MKKLIIAGFFCLFSILAKAEVLAQLDTAQVSLDEPFRLILTQNNMQAGSSIPDLNSLRQEFMIVGTERGINYSIVNGQSQSSTTWVISLKAQKAGTLTIPPIKIGDELTQPLTINVINDANSPDSSTDLATQQQDIMLITELSEKKPYVNQQIIYKVTLYNSKQLLDANYQGPKVDNALLIPLGGEKRYQTQKNNVQYLVEEQNYAVFPQKSGSLKIIPPVFTALVYSFDPKRVKTEAKPITLEVQPIPKQFTGKIWLPAKHVKLTEDYENIHQTLSQGSTLVRTVTLEGVGIPAQLLPNLHFAETEAFSVYPEKGKEKNQIVQEELVSSTKIKVTYLFNQSGNVTIPELKLPWFNTNTGQEELATLAPRTLKIMPSATAPAMLNAPTQQVQTKNHDSPAPASTTTQTENNGPWIVATLFALAWLLTLILWGWQKYRKNSSKGSYKKALRELRLACTQGNPQYARDALLKWANLHWPDAPILNLTDLTRLTNDIQLKKQVQLLSQALYQGAEKILWRGDELWRSIPGIKTPTSKSKNKEDILPPINPS